jgi:hypothetical protein
MSGPTRRQQEMRKRLRGLAPLIPFADSEPVLERALKLNRAELSLGAALWLALVAHVRHRHTEYDALLAEGYDRDAARHFVVDAIEDVLASWGCSERLDLSPEPEDITASGDASPARSAGRSRRSRSPRPPPEPDQ